MRLSVGTQVEHEDFGFGTVQQVVGDIAVVRFYGEDFEVAVGELKSNEEYQGRTAVNRHKQNERKIAFRRAFEAINLGIVPPGPVELIELTMGGDQYSGKINLWLTEAEKKGLCKVIFGNYGTGKSHFLHLARAIALEAGWVVSYLEFDPKAADPAKPHLVYRSLMSNLHFPEKEDGSRIDGYMGFVREIRNNWLQIRDLYHFKSSPWFKYGFEALITEPHSDEQEYLDACGWVFGQNNALQTIRRVARYARLVPRSIPNMPKIKETAEIYVHHLVVIHEICKALKFKGLLIILDEAEHVRGYNVRRRERANNFFDILARTAHKPVVGDEPPISNDHYSGLPKYWENGPFFGLLVGLTEGDIFADPEMPLRESCAFLHGEEDRNYLNQPSSGDYEELCIKLFKLFNHHYPESTELISTDEMRSQIAAILKSQFKQFSQDENPIRIWVKLASLVPSILLSERAGNIEELTNQVQKTALEATSYVLPWEL